MVTVEQYTEYAYYFADEQYTEYACYFADERHTEETYYFTDALADSSMVTVEQYTEYAYYCADERHTEYAYYFSPTCYLADKSKYHIHIARPDLFRFKAIEALSGNLR